MRLHALAIALSLFVAAPSARADSAEAELAIDHGVAFRRAHRDAEALAEFRRAYAIAPTARALAQVALAEAAIELWSSAETDLLRALASDDPWIERQRPSLQLALNEIDGHLATLEIGGPDGAELWIDGKLVAQLPTPLLRVPAKHLIVELRATGFATARREVDLLPRTTERMEFSLEQVHAKPDAEPPERVVRNPVASEPPPSPHRDRTAAWTAAGGAAVFLVGGVALTSYEFDRAGHYNSGACADMPGLLRSVRCGSYASEARAAQVAAITSYALGGAAAVTSVVLFLLAARDSQGHARLQCVPSFAGGTCEIRF
jgi:hypothetical protein